MEELIALMVVSLVIVGIYTVAYIVTYERRQHRSETDFRRAMLRQGLLLAPDLSSVTSRVYTLLEPLGPDRPEVAFSFSVGGREAFLYEWRTTYWAGDEYWHAYVILGPGAPSLRVMSKAFLGKPPHPIEFAEDRRFSKAFWVEGTETGATRVYLGPALRRFLLAQGKEWGFLGGPEGVALVRHIGGVETRQRLPAPEASETAAIFERLAAVTEAAARR